MKKEGIKTTILVAFIVLSFNLFGQQENYNVQILVPERDGIHVGESLDVTGRAIIPKGEFLWVLVHRTRGYQYVWYPQSEALIDPVTREWEATVTFGQPPDIGYDFEIVAIVVNDMEHRKLVDYFKKAMTSGDWRPIEMPPTQTAPVYRKELRKVSH